MQALWAVERGAPVLVKEGTLMCYSETGSGETRQRFLERVAAQPELCRFERCLRLHLANYPEYDPRRPEATLLDALPNTQKCLVRL